MRQVLQHLGSGRTEVVDVPVGQPGPGEVLVATRCTLISAGTERAVAEFGRASLLEKALQQPEKVRQVLDKIRTDGLLQTLDAVRSKLDQPLALGYCNVGRVISTGRDVTALRIGDRVVSNGGHASIVCVPKNLCVPVPDTVPDEAAVFAVVAAIGLQGLRLAQPTIGETVVVTGLGLIGLLTVQMLRAQGCRVLGIDPDPERLKLASGFGAETVSTTGDPLGRALEFSRGRGVDAVVITASTSSSEPVAQAARMCRKRGRIVLVGVAGLELVRQDFYEKELTFQVSCSYGPGRYDPDYEKGGHDYPLGFVRWTEQRNFEAALDLMAAGAMNVAPLISHRFPLDSAAEAYAILTGAEPSLGILLDHPQSDAGSSAQTVALKRDARGPGGHAVVGCIGAGNYGGRVLIPAIAAAGGRLDTLVTTSGVNAVLYGKKYGFVQASTDTAALFDRAEVNTIVVATRHDSHASLAVRALRSGRNVYVEKPLALTREELREVEEAYRTARTSSFCPILMVGFNRRFSEHVERMHSLLKDVPGPRSMTLLINAGAIPRDHWTQDARVGGGRIVGEACHFIDLARYLAGAPIQRTTAGVLRSSSDASVPPDTAAVTLEFADGSLASIQYFANGHRAFPKERIEVFVRGRVLQLDNFRRLRVFGWPRRSGLRSWKQDKGHRRCVSAFLNAVASGGPPPIPADEIFEVSRAAIDAAEALRQR